MARGGRMTYIWLGPKAGGGLVGQQRSHFGERAWTEAMRVYGMAG